jgi:hypothetical protein
VRPRQLGLFPVYWTMKRATINFVTMQPLFAIVFLAPGGIGKISPSQCCIAVGVSLHSLKNNLIPKRKLKGRFSGSTGYAPIQKHISLIRTCMQIQVPTWLCRILGRMYNVLYCILSSAISPFLSRNSQQHTSEKMQRSVWQLLRTRNRWQLIWIEPHT